MKGEKKREHSQKEVSDLRSKEGNKNVRQEERKPEPKIAGQSRDKRQVNTRYKWRHTASNYKHNALSPPGHGQ